MRASDRANPGLQRRGRYAYLGRCDLVKFAKVDASDDEIDRIFIKAKELVNHTTPAPEPDAEQTARSASA